MDSRIKQQLAKVGNAKLPNKNNMTRVEIRMGTLGPEMTYWKENDIDHELHKLHDEDIIDALFSENEIVSAIASAWEDKCTQYWESFIESDKNLVGFLAEFECQRKTKEGFQIGPKSELTFKSFIQKYLDEMIQDYTNNLRSLLGPSYTLDDRGWWENSIKFTGPFFKHKYSDERLTFRICLKEPELIVTFQDGDMNHCTLGFLGLGHKVKGFSYKEDRPDIHQYIKSCREAVREARMKNS